MNEELKNKINEKKDTFIDAAKEKGNALLEWCIDNPLKAGIIFSILTKVGKTAVSEHKYRRDERKRHTREYDPSLGLYYDLKRPLTNREKLELSRRHQNGESIGDILNSFNVLY